MTPRPVSDGFTVQASRKVETDAADARSVGLKAHIFSMSARMAFGVRENAGRAPEVKRRPLII